MCSINSVQEYTGSLEYESFIANRMIRKAVERELGIIGKTMNSILTINPDIALSDSGKIANLQILFSDEYATLSNQIIWSLATNNIPVLKKEIEKLKPFL